MIRIAVTWINNFTRSIIFYIRLTAPTATQIVEGRAPSLVNAKSASYYETDSSKNLWEQRVQAWEANLEHKCDAERHRLFEQFVE